MGACAILFRILDNLGDNPRGRIDRAKPSGPGVRMRTSSKFFDISPLEQRLLAELVEETPSKMIAKQLGVNEATLYRHMKSLYRKLGVLGRTEAIKLASPNR